MWSTGDIVGRTYCLKIQIKVEIEAVRSLIVSGVFQSSHPSLHHLTEFLELLHQFGGDAVTLNVEFLIRVECLHKDAVFRVENLHHADENLESHLTDTVIGAVYGEVILNIDVTVGIKVELHVTDLVIEHIAGFHNTSSLLLRGVGDQAEDASCNVIVVVAADEAHDYVRAQSTEKPARSCSLPW